MCLTQSLQQPQVGLFQTSTDGIDACAATQPGKPVTNAPRARAGIVTIARRNFFIGCSTQAEVERRRQGANCDGARFSDPRVSYSSIRLVRLSTASLRPRKQARLQVATDSRRRSKH
ncbi:MAG: hypothetical protein ABS56_02105 [Lautropia sp. SCN 69-89]|nr:MAG: hypothetical protein ABS56_02105 [Lautropia sp. SCN 69-89]OJX03942.1 MAG: hypothetical protein BGO72_12665 [Burkholderiales bacterium 70-64]